MTTSEQGANLSGLEAVQAFADQVLQNGRDQWSTRRTPLFADGVDRDTWAPIVWRHRGRAHLVSNLASQQNFLRTLVGLSRLTGSSLYRQAAMDAVDYVFQHFASPCGLLFWGGHTFVDLHSLSAVHIEGPHMEIKMHVPYYQLLWETAPEQTAALIRAFWNSNVRDWRRLEINRHAPYGKPMGQLWDSPYDDPAPLYQTNSNHCTTMPITDMTWAAASLSKLGKEAGALAWAYRLSELLTKARHPETGLGANKFTIIAKQQEIPAALIGTRQATFTTYGDRVQNQFGPEFGDTAIEAWILWGVSVRRLYVEYALAQMAIYEQLGPAGRPFFDWTVAGLKAYFRHAYDPVHRHFRALWADGTDMTGYRIKRDFGDTNQVGEPIAPVLLDSAFLLSYSRAYRLSGGDEELWQAVSELAAGLGLGQLGTAPTARPQLRSGPHGSDPLLLLALLELYRAGSQPAYLEQAAAIGTAIVRERFVNRLFLERPTQAYARFDAIEPLALLHLEAAARGAWDDVPAFVGGLWRYLQGPHQGYERTSDQKLFYQDTTLDRLPR